jgi:hypothetical protein
MEDAMAAETAGEAVRERLKRLVDLFPARKRETKQWLREQDLPGELPFRGDPPRAAGAAPRVPTFAPGVSRAASPQILARFAFAGGMNFGGEEWPAADEMGRWARRSSVRAAHRALREHWAGSAPNAHADGSLALLAADADVADHLVYLVWDDAAATTAEPSVWRYHGTEERRFRDLAEFLAYRIEG